MEYSCCSKCRGNRKPNSGVREKWKNLHSSAKKEFAGFKKDSKKTGGGPALNTPSAKTAKIIEIFQETPSFAGLEGFETTSAACT